MAATIRPIRQGLQGQQGFSLGSFLFYVTTIGMAVVFLFPLVRPPQVDVDKEQNRISIETDENTARELALRYGMSLQDLEGQNWGDPWEMEDELALAAGANGQSKKFLGATGLFGRPLTPTYGALLGTRGRSDIPLIGGINPKAKRDRNLWPLNTDFDLYSLGRDGKTSRLLSSPESQDDIIRANNGQFIGLASEY